MNINGYRITLDEAIEYIKENNCKKILLQIPEGLKPFLETLVGEIKKETDCEILVHGGPCYGACDLLTKIDTSMLDIDIVLHIGHLPIPSLLFREDIAPTIYVNAVSTAEITNNLLEDIPSKLRGEVIGLTTTAQHIHLLPVVREYLVEKGFKPIFSDGDNRISERGQILGCNYTAATRIMDEVDSYLFIGSGLFHPLGLRLATRKPVTIVDPISKQIVYEELEEKRDAILRQRFAAITVAREASNYGILVGLKPGQQRLKLAERIQKMVEEKEKKGFIIALDNFSPQVLEGFLEVDCYISTACPRIAIDDYHMYKKPILTPVELEIALGLRNWDSYEFDQILK